MNYKWILLILCILLSGFLAFVQFGTKLALSNNGFSSVGLIFSVLTAAIITMMSIVGLANYPNSNWRKIWRDGRMSAARLSYLTILFSFLMLTLALMVIHEISESIFKIIIEYALGFLIPFSFLIALPTPIIFAKIKTDEINDQIQNKLEEKNKPHAQ